MAHHTDKESERVNKTRPKLQPMTVWLSLIIPVSALSGAHKTRCITYSVGSEGEKRWRVRTSARQSVTPSADAKATRRQQRTKSSLLPW